MRSLLVFVLASSSLLTGALTAQTKVLFLTRQRTAAPVTLKAADPQILAFLQQRYGAANVTWMSSKPDTLIPPEPALTVDDPRFYGYDAIVISATIESGDLRGKINNTNVGIVNMEGAIARNLTGEFQVVDPVGRYPLFETEPAHGIIIRASHPITAGLPLNVPIPICHSSAEVWWSEAIAPGAVNLASDDDTSANGYLTYVDEGARLYNALVAPCRRVMFGMGNATFSSFNTTGQQIFGQAVDWAAANCCAQVYNYGTGLAGQLGIPTLTTSDLPRYGASIDVLASNSSGFQAPAIFMLGYSPASLPVLGGTLLTTPIVFLDVSVPASGLVLPVSIPGGFCTSIYGQLVQIDASAPFGVSMTPGMAVEIGY